MTRSLWAGFVLLLLASCARPPQPVWTEVPEAEQLLLRLKETTGKVYSLDGAAAVGLTVHGKHVSSQQFLLAEKPDRIRTDVLTGFGQLILQLTSDGEELAVFLNTPVPGKFYRGPASDENLARFTRVPLADEDLLRLLMYDPPLIDYLHTEVTVLEEGVVLELWNAERGQELLFDPQLQLVGCRYLTTAEPLLEVVYQKFDENDRFPRTVRIDLPQEETRVVLRFSELQTNVAIAAERFRLKTPANLQVEALP